MCEKVRNFALDMFENCTRERFPFLIAGPCSAESFEQMEAVCRDLADIPQVKLIRCGVWKPRSRPGGFEGAGEEALRWMSRLKTSMPQLRFAVEVAKPSHVELCLRYGVDALWVGARTVGDPFAISDLSDALRGCVVPMLVKNPQAADLRLWLGAVERLLAIGLTDLAVVHRGFTSGTGHELRNDPVWQIPIELKRTMPNLPLFCDPSHLSGRRDRIAALSHTALELDFDGLMIECHPDPDHALTDAEQQITPHELRRLVETFGERNAAPAEPNALTVLRERLNLLDAELVRILAQRLDVVRDVAAVKTQNGMTIYQPRQWDAKLQHCLQHGRELGLDADFITHIFEAIHMESIRVQQTASRDEPIADPTSTS